MLEIGTKIYYLKSNGNIIFENGDCRGFVVESREEEDFENYEKLKEYNRESVGVLQLKYGELNRLLEQNKANSYKVDVTEEPHKLVFEWIDYDSGKPTERPKSEVETLKEQIEKMKVDHAKQIAELVEKSESDKLELSTAIVELTEQLAQQG